MMRKNASRPSVPHGCGSPPRPTPTASGDRVWGGAFDAAVVARSAGTAPLEQVDWSTHFPPCVRIDVVRVFQNLGARDERVQWKCVRNIHKHFKRSL